MEGAHSKLKRDPALEHTSPRNMLSLVTAIINVVADYRWQGDAALSKARRYTLHNWKTAPLMSEISTLGQVSSKALRLTQHQISRAEDQQPMPPCTGSYTVSMGIPCSHTIRRYLQQSLILKLDDFHRH